MSSTSHQIGLLGDFNLRNLAALLGKCSGAGSVRCTEAPFGQTQQVLLNAGDEFWRDSGDALVLWTLPELAVPEFQKALDCQGFSATTLLAEVDAFCACVQGIPDGIKTILIPTWLSPDAGRGMGPLNLVNGTGVSNALMRMNLRLADQLANDPRVILLDSQGWLVAGGPAGSSPKLWYMSKTPFHTTVLNEAARDIMAALDGLKGRSKKLLVLDLDNTLWGGIVGDDGWGKLRLGGHDPIGEAFVDFQRNLKRLANRGVLLALASKNEESVAMEAIRSHPEMVLRVEDFAGWKIDWNDKAQNIAELTAALNLGLDSAVFLDDNPVERARVKEALPQVEVPDLPQDPMLYATFLRGLRCFDNPIVSHEDRKRNSMYVADRQRTALKAEVKSLADWLQMLDLRVEITQLDESNLERAAQLLNKTNQMNLSTRRLVPVDLLAWSRREGNELRVYRIADKFGDYGLCGITSLTRDGDHARLVDFLLSCRVMGRGVEETMLIAAARLARSRGCTELLADLVPTPKNQPCERWLQSQPQLARDKNSYRLGLGSTLEFPGHVRVISSTHEEVPA